MKTVQELSAVPRGSEENLAPLSTLGHRDEIGARLSLPRLRLLQGAACIVIILWGITAASHLVGLALLGILLACVFLPLPEWLMQRFKLGKTSAIGLAAAFMGTLSLVTVFYLYERISHLSAKLPIYHEHFMILYERVLVFLNAHGVNLVSQSTTKLPSSERYLELSRLILPEAGRVLSDGLMMSVLGLIFLIVMVEDPKAGRGLLGEKLYSNSEDVRRYIVISAKTGAIAALANLVLFLALGVDFPVVWCVLYFFLRFIPNVGFILALVPPTLLALLMSGWQRAIFVASGIIVINLLTDYGLTPIFMKKGVDISFVEITLSLVVWGALLGPVGAVLAIPLTVALRKIVVQQSHHGELASATS